MPSCNSCAVNVQIRLARRQGLYVKQQAHKPFAKHCSPSQIQHQCRRATHVLLMFSSALRRGRGCMSNNRRTNHSQTLFTIPNTTPMPSCNSCAVNVQLRLAQRQGLHVKQQAHGPFAKHCSPSQLQHQCRSATHVLLMFSSALHGGRGCMSNNRRTNHSPNTVHHPKCGINAVVQLTCC